MPCFLDFVCLWIYLIGSNPVSKRELRVVHMAVIPVYPYTVS